ncbi:MAG: M15 family metallopeptidase [Succinatimonas sp.]|nr:M15 family metallopeptidase [Succinatimonas sp.]MDD6754535.1 M15 family metallopeptidase [Succinatimonas sp.]
MKFVMIKRSCLRLFVLLLSLYLLSAQNIVNALTFKADGFSVTTIDDTTFARMKGKTYKDNCTVPLSELRHVKVLYKNKAKQTLKGEIVCNKHIADDVAEIFYELYKANYPIERIRLMDDYNADDETAMRDNNTSSFNFRFISHSTKVSKHGLGLAVDLNTLYNPFVLTVDGKLHVEPETALKYVDRSKNFDYKIDENDLAYKLFIQHGFEWGGHWKTRKDYQHFELPDDKVKELYPNNKKPGQN